MFYDSAPTGIVIGVCISYIGSVCIGVLVNKENINKALKQGAGKFFWSAAFSCALFVLIIADKIIFEYLDSFMKYRTTVRTIEMVFAGISLYLFCRAAWEATIDEPEKREEIKKTAKRFGIYLLIVVLVTYIWVEFLVDILVKLLEK